MVEEAPVVDLFKSPQHPYTISLLRCIPRMGTSKYEDRLWSIPGRVPPLHSLPNYCIFSSRCAMAQDACRESQPPLVNTSPERRSRCLFWEHPDFARLEVSQEAPFELSLERNTSMAHASLEVKDLKVHFQVTGGMTSLSLKKETVKALDGINLSLPPQNTVGIVGESGCGKSTLARAVAGLVPIAGGEIRMDGNNLSLPVTKRSKDTLQILQMVFQNPDSTLNPQKTVEQELQRPIRLFQVARNQEESLLISQLLAAVNLDESYRQRYPAQLSGGEKQRVAIARALVGASQLILCDEPTSSLDVSVQSMVLNLLQRIQKELGLSLMFISHDLGVVRYISDYIGVVYLGQFCEYGKGEEVFLPPYHPYTEALLSAIPIPDPTVQKERIALEGSVPSAINPPQGCRFHTRCPRKLGSLCEQEAPPANREGTHVIFCHIPRDELARQQKSAV